MIEDSVTKKIVTKVTERANKKGRRFLGKRQLSYQQIFDIINGQFETVADIIADKKFVELPHLGRFYVKDGRDKYLEPEKRYYQPHYKTDE